VEAVMAVTPRHLEANAVGQLRTKLLENVAFFDCAPRNVWSPTVSFDEHGTFAPSFWLFPRSAWVVTMLKVIPGG